MTSEEMREEFYVLYDMMANSNNVAYMQAFGQVHKEMMEWMIQNRPSDAMAWIEKLESIRWKNYLTQKEAEKIVAVMVPSAPWTREQWKAAMEKHGYSLEHEPDYNRCALWVVMNMEMSDSGKTINEYVDSEKVFPFVYKMAVDKLTDKDGKFNVRTYFGV